MSALAGPTRRAGDGGKKARSPGRARKKPEKTIAQGMPECFGEPVVTNSCAFHFRTRGYGCIERPAFPAPSLFSREDHLQKLGREARRECGSVSGKRVSSPLPSALFRTGRRDPYFVISAILCSRRNADWRHLFQQPKPVAMGPCVRRDDVEEWGVRLRLSSFNSSAGAIHL
jgi:hypothetical protein